MSIFDRKKINVSFNSIDQRVEKMFQLGLEKEVKDLLNKYPTDLKAFQGIGYKDFIFIKCI